MTFESISKDSDEAVVPSACSSISLRNILHQSDSKSSYHSTKSEIVSESDSAHGLEEDESFHPSNSHFDGQLDKKRFLIVKEIADTEASYLSSLLILIDEYMEPLKRDKILTPAQISTLFSNVESFPTLHQTILGNLNTRIGSWTPGKTCIGDIFLQSAPFLKLYSVYITNFDNASALLQDIKDSSKGLFGGGSFRAFRNFEKKLSKKNAGMNLMAYLLTPVQRIPRYRLLLEDLLKKTPKDHDDFEQVSKALQIIAEIATFNNEQMKLQDSLPIMAKLEKNLKGHDFELVVSSRTFISEDRISVSHRFKKQPRLVIMFNDMILFASATYQYKVHLKLDEIESMQIEAGDGQILLVIKPGHLDALLKLGNGSQQVNDQDRLLHLIFETNRDRDAWFQRAEKVREEWNKTHSAIQMRQKAVSSKPLQRPSYSPGISSAKAKSFSPAFSSLREKFSQDEGSAKAKSPSLKSTGSASSLKKSANMCIIFQDEWRKTFFEFPHRSSAYDENDTNLNLDLWEYLRRLCENCDIPERSTVMFGCGRQATGRNVNTQELFSISTGNSAKDNSNVRLIVLFSDMLVFATDRFRYLIHIKLNEIEEIYASQKFPNMLEIVLRSSTKLEAKKHQEKLNGLIQNGPKKKKKREDPFASVLNSGKTIYVAFKEAAKRDEWYETICQFRKEWAVMVKSREKTEAVGSTAAMYKSSVADLSHISRRQKEALQNLVKAHETMKRDDSPSSTASVYSLAARHTERFSAPSLETSSDKSASRFLDSDSDCNDKLVATPPSGKSSSSQLSVSSSQSSLKLPPPSVLPSCSNPSIKKAICPIIRSPLSGSTVASPSFSSASTSLDSLQRNLLQGAYSHSSKTSQAALHTEAIADFLEKRNGILKTLKAHVTIDFQKPSTGSSAFENRRRTRTSSIYNTLLKQLDESEPLVPTRPVSGMSSNPPIARDNKRYNGKQTCVKLIVSKGVHLSSTAALLGFNDGSCSNDTQIYFNVMDAVSMKRISSRKFEIRSWDAQIYISTSVMEDDTESKAFFSLLQDLYDEIKTPNRTLVSASVGKKHDKKDLMLQQRSAGSWDLVEVTLESDYLYLKSNLTGRVSESIPISGIHLITNPSNSADSILAFLGNGKQLFVFHAGSVANKIDWCLCLSENE